MPALYPRNKSNRLELKFGGVLRKSELPSGLVVFILLWTVSMIAVGAWCLASYWQHASKVADLRARVDLAASQESAECLQTLRGVEEEVRCGNAMWIEIGLSEAEFRRRYDDALALSLRSEVNDLETRVAWLERSERMGATSRAAAVADVRGRAEQIQLPTRTESTLLRELQQRLSELGTRLGRTEAAPFAELSEWELLRIAEAKSIITSIIRDDRKERSPLLRSDNPIRFSDVNIEWTNDVLVVHGTYQLQYLKWLSSFDHDGLRLTEPEWFAVRFERGGPMVEGSGRWSIGERQWR